MLRKNKVATFIILSLLALTSAAAEGYKPKAPKKGNVLVMGKLAYKKPIDIAGREEAFRKFGFGGKTDGEAKDFSIIPDFSNKLFDNVSNELEGYFYQEIKVPKDGKLHLNSIQVNLFTHSSKWFAFKLPVDVTINVPDDAVYVYIGTFQYDLDYALRIKGFLHLDEYEQAKKTLSRELGFTPEFYRAALVFDKKK